MSPRKLRIIHSPTPEWEALRRFYRDVLLLPETGGWALPGDRGSFLAAGAGEIEIMERDAAVLGILPPGAGWRLALEVADADGERARLGELGVDVAREVEVRPWGSRDFVVRDPAGNEILLFSEGRGGDC